MSRMTLGGRSPRLLLHCQFFEGFRQMKQEGRFGLSRKMLGLTAAISGFFG
jgi:hypothetical protein